MDKNVEDKKLTLIKVMLIVSIAILLTSFVLLFLSQKSLKESENKDANIYEKLAGLFGIKIKKYTVRFNTNGAGTLADQKVKFLRKVKKPAELIKKGYKFVAWKLGNNKTFNFKTRVTKNLSLTATWRPYKFECKNTKVAGVQVCVDRYVLPNRKQLQNFAITDKYVYFSAPLYGAWADKESEVICQTCDREKQISNSHVVRLNKSDFNNYLVTEMKYSGHGQSFDVKTESGKDVVFFNNAASAYYENGHGWGAQSNGIAITKLDETSFNAETGKGVTFKTRMPGKTLFINDKSKKIDVLLTASYNSSNRDKNVDNYYKDLLKKANSKNYSYGEVSVKGNLLAYRIKDKTDINNSEHRIRVYNLNAARNNYKYNKLVEYYASGPCQGIALSGKGNEVLKLYQDGNNVKIQRYNVNAKGVQSEAAINLAKYYESGNFETEGIKVYKEGNIDYVYIGIARKNTSPRESDILRIKYNDLKWVK